MKNFMDDDFLLETETAKSLYHKYASKMPIYDYHCHLSIKEIYENRHFDSITDLWLVDGHAGDHYKWRAMRNNGVDEFYITGNADKFDKFKMWADTIPYLVGNPLFAWTHLELKKYFGINKVLNLNNAEEIYNKMNDFLKDHGARDIINMSGVDTICTTDDPIDDLHYHINLAKDDSFKVKVYPAFRPDKLINIDWNTFNPYIKSLSDVVGYDINSLDNLLKAIDERIEFFNSVGCKISDHALDVVMYEDATFDEVDKIFEKALNNEELSNIDIAKYRGFIVFYLGKKYHEYNWVQQYHIKAQRNNNSKSMNNLGPDTGFDCISDTPIIKNLARILDNLDSCDSLPKTILYSLNPSDFEALATLGFCYTEKGIPGKVQLGSAWWFLDQKDGMEHQLTSLSNLGLLSRFVGMLTDSRSFLSYTRHEYFRRILCNKIGHFVENGEYPNDLDFLGKVVEDICYNNAKKYFDSSR